MPTQVNDFYIQLDEFSGYAGNGNRRISIDLSPAVGGMSANAQFQVISIPEGGPVTGIAQPFDKGVLIVDLSTNLDPVPESKRSIINYSLTDPAANDPEKTGRIIIDNIGFDLNLPTITLSYQEIPDVIELPIGLDNLISVYDMNTIRDAGSVNEYNRCKPVSDVTACGCETKEDDVACEVKEVEFNATFSIPDAEDTNNPPFEGEANARIRIHLKQKTAPAAALSSNDIPKDIERITIDLVGAERGQMLTSNMRFHLDLENILVVSSEDERICTPVNSCNNRFSAQAFIVQENQVLKSFFLGDNYSALLLHNKSTSQLELRLKESVFGGSFDSLDKSRGSGGGQMTLDISLILSLDIDGNITGYTVNGNLQTLNDEINEIDKQTNISLVGSGTIQDSTDTSGRTIASTGSLNVEFKNRNLELQNKAVVDSTFNIQIDDTDPQTSLEATGTFTVNTYDGNLAQVSRTIITPEISFSFDGTNPVKTYSFDASLNIVDHDENLVQTGTNSYEASSAGTISDSGKSWQIVEGTANASVEYSGDSSPTTINNVSYEVKIHDIPSCKTTCQPEFEKPLFTLNTESGFWNKAGATHQIVYAKRSGITQKIGLILIKKESVNRESFISLDIPSQTN